MSFDLIRRRDPIATAMLDLRKNFDDMFGRFWSYPALSNEPLAWTPHAETFLEKGKYHLKLHLPDINPKDVKIEVTGNQLVVTGERKEEKQLQDRTYFECEVMYGNFERTFTLPEGIKAEAVEAVYDKGVLEITAPVSEKALPKKIEVKVPIELARKSAA
jgi:HSP20 family protein